MQTENTVQQPVPLYKRLDEQRTQGEWITERDTENTNSAYLVKDIHTNWVATFGTSSFHEYERECKSNVQYTALSVNNLAPIADALAVLIEEYKRQQEIEYYAIDADKVLAAEQALAKIS